MTARPSLMPADEPSCPHCESPINMRDSDIYCRHTTYWGDDGPRSHACLKCNRDFWIQERVERTWVAGRTPDEARDG